MAIRSSLVFGFLFLLAACGGPEPAAPPPAEPIPAASGQPATPEPGAEEPDEDQVLAIFLGDSLTAGNKLQEHEAFPALLEDDLRAAGHELRVVNGGISGDTTAGGLARLDWLLRQQPDVLFVCLGANDGGRGTPLEATEGNLRAIIERAQAAGARVLLAGMLMPPNLGPDYTEGFAAIYPRLAAEFDVPLIPFLLEGVALRPELNLYDGVHPNPAGQRVIADTVRPYLETLLDEVTAGADSNG